MIQSTTTGITKRIGCECGTIQSFNWSWDTFGELYVELSNRSIFTSMTIMII